jgi:hypothetical protein
LVGFAAGRAFFAFTAGRDFPVFAAGSAFFAFVLGFAEGAFFLRGAGFLAVMAGRIRETGVSSTR